MQEMGMIIYSRLIEEKDRLLLHWRDYSPIYKMYLISYVIQIKRWLSLYYVEMVYFLMLGVFCYLIFENFSLHLEHHKNQLNLHKRLNQLEEENKKMRKIWEDKLNEEEYRSESKYHQGMNGLQIQYDQLSAQTENIRKQMQERKLKEDEWKNRVRNHIKIHQTNYESLQKCFTVQEDVNGGFRNEIRILKGRITKLRTHVDKHLYDEDDEYVEVSE
jgi:uncharacterized protein YukE